MTPKKIYLSKLVMAGAEILDKPVSDGDVEYIRADVIRNEIERRKSLLTQHSKLTYDLILETFIKEYDDLLSFLSALESEKPMNQKGLEREIERCLWKLSDDPSNDELRMFARHFAEWGAEHLKK